MIKSLFVSDLAILFSRYCSFLELCGWLMMMRGFPMKGATGITHMRNLTLLTSGNDQYFVQQNYLTNLQVPESCVAILLNQLTLGEFRV
jgi:hypothetical protein